MSFCMAKYRGFLLASSLAMVVEFLMGLADSVVCGHVVGETALSGVSLLQTPMNVISFVAALFGTGTAVCFSLDVGRFDKEGSVRTFSQGFWSAVSCGALLVGGMLLGRDAFLGLFGAALDVRAQAVAYWNWFVPCAFLEPVVFLLSNACYADGDGRICIVAYVVQFVGNCVLSVPLTFAMGVGGCALGTAFGHVGALVVLVYHFRRKTNTLRLVRHFAWRDFARLVRTSFGDASVRLCWALLFLLLGRYVIVHFGSGMLPALAAAIVVMGLSEAFNGPPNAAQPLVGVYMGEGNVVGVRSAMRAALRTSLVASAGLSALLVAFPELAVRLVGIDDAVQAVDAAQAVRCVSGGLCGFALVSLFNSYFLFIERAGLSCSLTVLANLVVPLVLYHVLGACLGARGVWLALGAAPIVSCVFFGIFLLLRHGRTRFPWLLDRAREARLRVFDLDLEPARICEVSSRAAEEVRRAGISAKTAARVALIIEETFMVVKDRNAACRVRAEATLDLTDGVSLVLRDDGEIFDITDADARISSLRTYLVASIMETQPSRCNLTTSGFNRNVFRFPAEEA